MSENKIVQGLREAIEGDVNVRRVPITEAAKRLDPCPFCGPKGDLVFTQPCVGAGYGVICRTCHTNMDVRSLDLDVVVAAWNARAILAAPQANNLQNLQETGSGKLHGMQSAPQGQGAPVGWTGSGSLEALKAGLEGHIWPTEAKSHPVALYAIPQTTPVTEVEMKAEPTGDNPYYTPRIMAGFRAYKEAEYGGKMGDERFRLGVGQYADEPYYTDIAVQFRLFKAGAEWVDAFRAAERAAQSVSAPYQLDEAVVERAVAAINEDGGCDRGWVDKDQVRAALQAALAREE